jgi:hypothetical protein
VSSVIRLTDASAGKTATVVALLRLGKNPPMKTAKLE